MARWRPSEALSLDDPVLAVDLDRAVSLFGRHVESEMDEAARALQDKWQKACDAKRGSGKRAGKTPPPPSRQDYRDAADAAWQRTVRRIRIWGPFGATSPTSRDFDDLRSNVTYTIEKDLDNLTGSPLIDGDCWAGPRRMIWSDGRVDEFDR